LKSSACCRATSITFRSPIPTSGSFGWHDAQVVARLKPGVLLAAAADSMNALSLQLTAKLATGGHRVILTPLREEMAGKTKTALSALLAAAAALLLIACVNLANLLPTRGTARAQEVRIRAALGAGNGRLVTQFLMESLVLSVFGAIGGLVLAIPLMRLLQALLPAAMGPVQLVLNWRVLACGAVIASTATLIFGLVPAVWTTRAVRKEGLVEGDRGAARTRSHWFQYTLIVVETTLAVVLMASGGVLIETFRRLSSTDLGFRPAQVLTFETVLFRYGQLDREEAFVDAILEKIRAIPGVVSDGASNELPLRAHDPVATFYWLEGQPRKEANEQVAQMRVVTRGYFSTIGATLNEGRWFESSDRRSNAPVAIVNETFAHRHFAGRSAIGTRFKYGQFDDKGYWYTIVGVLKDIRETALTEALRPTVYRVQDQADQVGIQTSSVAVRTTVDPLSIVPAVRQAVSSVDPNQAIWRFKTLGSVVDREFATSRQSTALMTAFALLALVLASLGLYGVLSYSVAERTGEIGVRMALGAAPSNIVHTFVSRGLTLTLVGLAGGSLLAGIVLPAMTPLLYGLHPNYVPVASETVAVLLTVAMVACLLPARRASRIDPMIALRKE
jgi:predicted permease